MAIVSEIEGQPLGPLAQKVMRFGELHDRISRRLTREGGSADVWSPLAELVATDRFRRVGAYLEEMDWAGYLAFLTEWASGTSFDSTLKAVSEAGRSVFYEIEERHDHDGERIVKNVIAVYKFDAAGLIEHLDIYEQAQDSGRWIEAAARAASGG